MFVLISDLYEGGVEEELLKRVASMVSAGVTVVVLLALADEGAAGVRPAAGRRSCSALGAPAFACTPDLFPDLMGVAIARRDITAWAAEAGITVAGTAKPEAG